MSSTIKGTLKGILSSIREGKICKIAVLTGAGCSTAAGIPDFRSAGGLYDTLRPELLTASEKEKALMRADPTMVVNIELFSQNPFPYLEVRRPFILGTAEEKWKATAAHFFIRVLFDKGLLIRLYSQNIDGLDFQTGISDQMIVNLHGSLGKAECEFCNFPAPIEEFRKSVREKIKNIYDPSDPSAPKTSSFINCTNCGRPGVKAQTVMYGCSLPDVVYEKSEADFPDNVDCLIVIGTSLSIHPAAGLVTKLHDSVPRILINREPVGRDLGLSYAIDGEDEDVRAEAFRDAWMGQSADESVIEIAKELNMLSELIAFQHLMAPASQELLERYKDIGTAPLVIAPTTTIAAPPLAEPPAGIASHSDS